MEIEMQGWRLFLPTKRRLFYGDKGEQKKPESFYEKKALANCYFIGHLIVMVKEDKIAIQFVTNRETTIFITIRSAR